jgi:hypothetical protein
MKKNGWAVPLTWIAVVVLAMSPAVLSAQSITEQDQKLSIANWPIIGPILPMANAGIPIPPAVKGIQSTLNIPAFSFVPANSSTIYNTYWGFGGIEGAAGGSYLTAPVIFPKGAKKIVQIDWYVMDTTGAQIAVGMADAIPGVTAPTPICAGVTTSHASWWVYTWKPTTPYVINPTDVYFLEMIITNAAALRAVVITYKG